MFFILGGGTITDIISTTVSMLVSVVSAAAGLDCLGALYTAYKRACMRLDDERWLLENCKDRLRTLHSFQR